VPFSIFGAQDCLKNVAPVTAVLAGFIQDLEAKDVVFKVFAELLPGNFSTYLVKMLATPRLY
jgi:hypothetical protein